MLHVHYGSALAEAEEAVTIFNIASRYARRKMSKEPCRGNEMVHSRNDTHLFHSQLTVQN